jgi:hypothetical protein
MTLLAAGVEPTEVGLGPEGLRFLRAAGIRLGAEIIGMYKEEKKEPKSESRLIEIESVTVRF